MHLMAHPREHHDCKKGKVVGLKEPGVVYAWQAAGCHLEGGKPYQVVARGTVHIIGPFRTKTASI
jgi:hypothetical protein